MVFAFGVRAIRMFEIRQLFSLFAQNYIHYNANLFPFRCAHNTGGEWLIWQQLFACDSVSICVQLITEMDGWIVVVDVITTIQGDVYGNWIELIFGWKHHSFMRNEMPMRSYEMWRIATDILRKFLSKTELSNYPPATRSIFTHSSNSRVYLWIRDFRNLKRCHLSTKPKSMAQSRGKCQWNKTARCFLK